MATILTKKSDTASAVPLAADLTNAAGGAELAVNATDKRLFSKTSGGTVVELGTNPSTLVLPSGSANGVAYLNGSKVVTSGSALTFDGTNALTLFRTTATEANEPTIKFSNLVFAGQNAGVIKSSNGGLALDIQSPSDSTYQLRSRIYMNGGSGDSISFQASSNNGSTYGERMVLTSTGLGIGTSSPAYQLTVGTAGTTANSYIQIASTTTGTGNLFFGDTAGTGAGSYRGYIQYDHNVDALILASAGSERLRLDSSGNLGLGVTPSAWTTFKVMQLGNFGAIGGVDSTSMNMFANTFYDGAFKYINTSSASRYRMDDGHSWFTAPSGTAGNAITFTQAMSLLAGGNLLVGKTSADVSVNGFRVDPDGAIFSSIATGNETNYVYNTSASAYRFYVNSAGTVFATSTTISAISDQRFKENVRDLDAGLTEVMALKPRLYDWKEGKGANIKNARGFIAQEFETVFPDLIDEWKDEAPEGEDPYKSVRQDLIPVLVKAIQEQQAIIESLKARLDAANL